MAGGDPNQVLMHAAWGRLLQPGTKYYLPSVIVNGAQGNGVVVNALGQLVIADTGSIPLYESSTWGSVAVELKNATVGGLDTLSDGGMTYNSETGAFSATVAIGELTFDGEYLVSAGGIVGCAIDSASALLKGLSPSSGAIASAAPGIGAEGDLDLAVAYRDRLAGIGNGLELVSTYYDHNETLNDIVSTDSVFQAVWTQHETAGEGTAFYANQTATATASPNDPQATVGDENYRAHAAYIRALLFNRVVHLAEKTGDPEGRYAALEKAILEFKGQTDVYQQPMTAEAVMQQVASPTEAGAEDALADPDSVEARAERQAEADMPMWEERGAQLDAEQAAAAENAPTPVNGSFSDHVGGASLTITGTVSVVGTPPDTSLSVSLASITTKVPQIEIALSGEGKLLTDTEQAIADSAWFQQLLAKKVGDEVGSQQVLTYLAERVNQSISEALGPV